MSLASASTAVMLTTTPHKLRTNWAERWRVCLQFMFDWTLAAFDTSGSAPRGSESGRKYDVTAATGSFGQAKWVSFESSHISRALLQNSSGLMCSCGLFWCSELLAWWWRKSEKLAKSLSLSSVFDYSFLIFNIQYSSLFVDKMCDCQQFLKSFCNLPKIPQTQTYLNFKVREWSSWEYLTLLPVSWCLLLFQADSTHPGVCALCHLGDDAEIRLCDAPAASTGCSHWGKTWKVSLYTIEVKDLIIPAKIFSKTKIVPVAHCLPPFVTWGWSPGEVMQNRTMTYG